MPDLTKIATCSYCGMRTVLRLTARDGRELACGSCGAPLHEMKALKQPHAKQPKHVRSRADGYVDWVHGPPRKKPRRRRRKSPWKEMFEDAFDLFEDVFD